MNMTLKVLAAIALIAITIAAGIFAIRTWTEPDLSALKLDPKATIKNQESQPPELTQSGNVTETPEHLKQKFNAPIVVKKDDPLQPKYVPINQPTHLQIVRDEGKTYHSRTMGKIAGQASMKDYTFRGNAHFTYIYGMESIGKIIKNDGMTIIEERSFSNVIEDIIVSKYEVGIELPPVLQTGINLLCGFLGGSISGTTEGAAMGEVVGKGINLALSKIKIPFTDAMFDGLRQNKMLPKELDPQRVKNEMMMFSKLKDGKILEGKKVRITFVDGQGITGITPINCTLSQQEVDVIKRTNYVMDHYIFPDQQVDVDSTWEVGGDVFAGFLDPRLMGKVDGSVTIKRLADFINTKNEPSKRLRLVNGNISFSDNSQSGNAITGQVSGIRGICTMPNKLGVITSSKMHGSMIYEKVSNDHLLFDAQMTVTPRFEISYECEVK